ncbi:2-succinyl-5-enolpyruvyl-6-hydroxy-3-cyclohexene-1-carboxylic-acid synthase [Rhabdochromatium marinum]|uniref:2-succinyl-5-enolpyruvyl-6-hydroxy-3- cyclohexene-1-carboxylic-acid synthase n=1 Tax=Rhabdochromatium marinum TaxID=48729 RepID=UPI001907D8C8|nr:2-succinyl-5-enolpyruvyl-6-hydroxy-3-cyclohexene-1-carboxylic-acid synthase [Rhabdochromatium marinum]MBK1647705.1 2-succinyl-5-enolpyruvyl-6-hydroxy-3-cyclohexene-1-carboxylic-acid synthase [Rhabdochromatium marinum]
MGGNRGETGSHAHGAAIRVTGCLNLRWSLALLDGLIQGGLRHLVLSPGSRSTPVVLAARQRQALQLSPILDERSAAFFALGLARAGRAPVALLATSGSAPAHWYPAVIEAHHWGLPLLLLSADRPPLLRHSGANQTIDQTRLFGAYVREFHDPGLPRQEADSLKAIYALGLRAAWRSRAPQAGPVHINLPFDEPLVPAGDCEPEWSERPSPASSSPPPDERQACATAPRHHAFSRHHFSVQGVMVCGPASAASTEEAEALLRCARQLGIPLLADPLSGLRFASVPEVAPAPNNGPNSNPNSGSNSPLIRHYDALLRNPTVAARLQPDWVLRCGLAPVSKTLGQWLSGVPSWLLGSQTPWCDPGHDVQGVIADSALALADNQPAQPADPHWLSLWHQAEQATAALAEAHLHASPWCEAQMIQQLLAAIPSGEGLLCANSLPIRQLDTWCYARQQPLQLFGNRGVSGIDGQLSTLAGLNASGLPTWGLLGDLSFCHDLSGLLLVAELQRPLLVINNGGGRIFDYLPQGQLPELETYWRTPVTPDLGALVKPFGLRHQQVRNGTEFAAALAAAPAPGLIEIAIDAAQSRTMHLAYWQKVATAPLIEAGATVATGATGAANGR